MKEFDIFKDELLGIYQVRTKSNILTISFDDSEKEAIFNEIVSIFQEHNNPSIKYIKSKLLKSFDESKIIEVLYNLKQNALLVDNIELQDKGQDDYVESHFYKCIFRSIPVHIPVAYKA